jgi:large subunit ribosomal protein L17
MRHQKKGFKLGRTSSHRKATLSSLTTALIRHKRIETTLTKAKALRQYAEPIINRGKEDTTHNRREAFRHLQDKHAVTELFTEIGGKIKDRDGGYLRIVKLGQRAGDSAEMAVIELVDYNDVKAFGSSTGSGKKTRRAGRRKSGGAAAASAAPAVAEAEVAEEAAAVEAVEEAPEAEAAAEEAVEEAPVAEAEAEVAVEEAPAAEAVAEEAPAAEAAAEEAPAAEAAAEEAPAAEAAAEETPAAEEENDKEKDA